MKSPIQNSKRGKLKAEAIPLLFLVVFFTVFFWPATLAGRYFVSGDSLVYAYPLRVAAWEMIRQGALPLWTPHLLSGYPLLSMAQLGIGYPLTWFYLFLPGHAAEQIYVLAPYLLAPAFLYAYLRAVGRSRIAALLAGLSFAYGGMMISGLGQAAMFTNAVMWLPLMLIAIERARTRRFLPCLVGAGAAYAMSVLTGLGQGFLYAGIIALGYAAFLSLMPPGVEAGDPKGRPVWDRWRPLAVGVGGIVLAVGIAAFQILETMRAQRLSIRRELTYEIFSGGSFSATALWQSFISPVYHFNYETTAYLPLLAALFAVVAVIGAVIGAWRGLATKRRVLFWLMVAALAALLMMGDHTPIYQLAYRIPLINLFRIPWRHAFELTFAVSILAAYGWDAAEKFLARFSKPDAANQRRNSLIGLSLLAGGLAVGIAAWRLAARPVAAGLSHWPTGLSENSFLIWKLGFALLLVLAAVWAWVKMIGPWRGAMLATVVFAACFWEQYLLASHWWFPQAKPASYFTQISPPSRFLLNHAPEQGRVYTSIAPGFVLNLPRAEPHNLSVRRGLHDAAGYEPLMLERYSRAFGVGWAFDTPAFSAPRDKQILDPKWRVLDLLNVRFLAEFSAPGERWTEKDGARFAAGDAPVALPPEATITLAGTPAEVDSLSLVTNLSDSIEVADDQTVAKAVIRLADGRELARELKAGRDTAEWAHERADVRPSIRHSPARVFESRQGDGFLAHRYWTRIDLGGKAAVESVSITSALKEASLSLWKATLYDSTGGFAALLTPRLPAHWRLVYSRDDALIHENQRALPRVWLAPKAEVVSAEEALGRIRGEGEAFDPRQTALIERDDQTEIALPRGDFETRAEARIVSFAPNHLAIETDADKRAALVVSEINYPGWEATIDGQPTAIFATNYLLRGVIVPEGRHRVEMRYAAPAARLGAAISALSLLFVCGARWGAMAIAFFARRHRISAGPTGGGPITGKP